MSIDVLRFVRKHGVVLESAAGPVPNLAEAIAQSPIHGSWWSHPEGKRIFWATRRVRDSQHILVCRLITGKVTYVHERLWPAVIRLSKHFKKGALDSIHEEHSAMGKHLLKTVSFPKWVPLNTLKASKALSEIEAAEQLGSWVEAIIHSESRDYNQTSSSRKGR